MLIVVAAGFVVALVAPWLPARLRGATGWILSLVPAGIFAYLLSLLSVQPSGGAHTEQLRWAPSFGLMLDFRLDGLSSLFALLISGIGVLVVIYTGGYLGKHPYVGRFYALLLAFMGSMLGVVLADNVILLFVFWELTSFTSYLLIGFDHEKKASRDAALQALLVTGMGGLILLPGLLLLAMAGDSFRLSELIERRELIEQDPRAPLILACILVGAFTKSAQFPFHFWLPNAMAAPTPASAYLHSSTMVKAGIYLLARFFPLFSAVPMWTGVVTTVGAITMVAGAYLALRETYLKRLLAYTTLSVLGLLTMLLGIGSPLAVKAALVFLVAHAFYKAALFLVAGAIDHGTGERDVEKLGGLGRAMPMVAASAVLAALSMAGVIPTLGFLAKETVFEATLDAPQKLLLTACAFVAGLFMVTVAVLVGVKPFFGALQKTPHVPHQGSISLWLGPLLLAVAGLAVGLWPVGLSAHVVSPAVSAVLQTPSKIDLKLWHGFNLPLLLETLALAGGLALLATIGRVRRGLITWDILSRIGPARWYEVGLAGLNIVARLQTRFLQSGYLRYYLAIIILCVVALVGGVLLVEGVPTDIAQITNLEIHEVGLAALILAAAAMAVHARTRLAAIAALGVVGYGVGMIYVLFGAPDLAITQFVIETLTVILFVLVFYRLEAYRPLSSWTARTRDAVISLAAGALMTTLVLLAGASQWFERISHEYLDKSATLGHGRNVVNVILVDFRGIDTLGEITVLAIAAMGVYALTRLRPALGKDEP